MADITGTVTLDGSALEGAKITAIDTEAGDIIGTATSAADGTYTIANSRTSTAHCLFEYDDGAGTTYSWYSKPFVTIEGSDIVGTPTHLWRHDEGSGTVLNDSIGTLDSQTWVGAVWGSGDGDGGYHVHYDGVDDYIQFGTSNTLPNTNGSFSVVMWFRAERLATQEVSFGDYNDFFFMKQSDDSVTASYAGRTVEPIAIPSAALTADTWYMVAATRDEAGNISTYYNDLGLQNTATHDHVLSDQQHALGSNAGSNNFFQGDTDYLLLYDYELTAQDVLDIYNNTSSRYTGH